MRGFRAAGGSVPRRRDYLLPCSLPHDPAQPNSPHEELPITERMSRFPRFSVIANGRLLLVSANVLPRPVTNVQDMEAAGGVIDGEEQSVDTDHELANFVSERAILGRERTTSGPTAETVRPS